VYGVNLSVDQASVGRRPRRGSGLGCGVLGHLLHGVLGRLVDVVYAGLALQDASLLDGAAVDDLAVVQGRHEHGVLLHRVRDVLGDGVLASDDGDADVRGLAGLGEGVVPGIEVLALLSGLATTGTEMEARTFNLFWIRSLLLGSFPYRRNSRCSSGESFCGNVRRNWRH
jgi:hypothetical protein